ncbi:MAG: sugar nucleotide-binding protein [Patescibacteria group bacterium]
MQENIKKKKFYILGGSGFMGGEIVKYLKSRGHQVFSDKIDVSNFSALLAKLNETKPEVVVNFTGVRAYPNIDWCENNKEETVKINVGGAINATLAAIKAGAYPIQISSGCIYSGGTDVEFTEESEPNFFGSFYSRMRIIMQNALKEIPVLQVRIRMPIATFSHPRNLINKIISYPKIISIPNSITFLEDLWPALEKLAVLKPTGILNLTNDGYLNHAQILEVYKKIVDPNHKYTIISLDELQGVGGITKAKRSNCLLSNAKAKSLGLNLPAIDNKKLEEIMVAFKKSLLNEAIK